MWVLITRFGDPIGRLRGPRRVALRLYTAVGSTLMLVGICCSSPPALQRPGPTARGRAVPAARTSAHDRAAPHGRARRQGALFPTAHLAAVCALTIAPTAGSVLLAAVLLKMGTYGLVHFRSRSCPKASGSSRRPLPSPPPSRSSGVGLICLVERDLKRLIAYSSVAHMGFVVLGLATGSEVGLQAALYGNLAHGVISAPLFVVVGGLKRRWGASTWAGPGRPFVRSPCAVASCSSRSRSCLGLPGLAGFWGEFLVIMSAWAPRRPGLEDLFHVCAVLAAIGGLLAAAYSPARRARLSGSATRLPPRPGQSSEENTPLALTPTPHVLLTRPSGDAAVDVETRGVERVVLPCSRWA